MLEKTVVDKIRKHLKTEYGATVHKNHGGVHGELGHADLYGTLPGGQAFYFEVKAPGSRHDPARIAYQRIFMYAEKMNGAKAGFVTSVEDVDRILVNNEDLLWSEKT